MSNRVREGTKKLSPAVAFFARFPVGHFRQQFSDLTTAALLERLAKSQGIGTQSEVTEVYGRRLNVVATDLDTEQLLVGFRCLKPRGIEGLP